MLTLLGPPVIATQQTEQMSVLAAHVPGDTVRASFSGEHRGTEGMVSRDISLPDDHPRVLDRPLSCDHAVPFPPGLPLLQNFAEASPVPETWSIITEESGLSAEKAHSWGVSKQGKKTLKSH